MKPLEETPVIPIQIGQTYRNARTGLDYMVTRTTYMGETLYSLTRLDQGYCAFGAKRDIENVFGDRRADFYLVSPV